VENSKDKSEFPTLSSALGNPAKTKAPDFHIPTATAAAVSHKKKGRKPTSKSNILKLQDDSSKVTFLNCLTG
jgi:hypothetical protein